MDEVAVPVAEGGLAEGGLAEGGLAVVVAPAALVGGLGATGCEPQTDVLGSIFSAW